LGASVIPTIPKVFTQKMLTQHLRCSTQCEHLSDYPQKMLTQHLRCSTEHLSDHLSTLDPERGAAAWPRKSVRRCDYCGSQFGDMRPWDWPSDPPTRIIGLHERCEAPWYDSNGLPEGV